MNNDNLRSLYYLAKPLAEPQKNLPLSFSMIGKSQWAYLVLKAGFEAGLGDRWEYFTITNAFSDAYPTESKVTL